MADLSYIDSTLEVKVVGQDSTGLRANYVGADSNGNMTTKDAADGTAGGVAPTTVTMVGGEDPSGNVENLNFDSSGNLLAKDSADGPVTPGTVAANSTLSGSQYNSSLPAPTNTQQVALQSNQFGELAVVLRNKYRHIAGAATTTVKSGSGRLHTVCLNTTGNSTTVTLFDNTAGSGTVIAVIGTGPAGATLTYDVEFSTGLTIVTTNAATDITISYQ